MNHENVMVQSHDLSQGGHIFSKNLDATAKF